MRASLEWYLEDEGVSKRQGRTNVWFAWLPGVDGVFVRIAVYQKLEKPAAQHWYADCGEMYSPVMPLLYTDAKGFWHSATTLGHAQFAVLRGMADTFSNWLNIIHEDPGLDGSALDDVDLPFDVPEGFVIVREFAIPQEVKRHLEDNFHFIQRPTEFYCFDEDGLTKDSWCGSSSNGWEIARINSFRIKYIVPLRLEGNDEPKAYEIKKIS